MPPAWSSSTRASTISPGEKREGEGGGGRGARGRGGAPTLERKPADLRATGGARPRSVPARPLGAGQGCNGACGKSKSLGRICRQSSGIQAGPAGCGSFSALRVARGPSGIGTIGDVGCVGVRDGDGRVGRGVVGAVARRGCFEAVDESSGGAV
jgi:hypothetical protein